MLSLMADYGVHLIDSYMGMGQVKYWFAVENKIQAAVRIGPNHCQYW